MNDGVGETAGISPATKVMHDLAVQGMSDSSKHHCFICDIAEPEASDVTASFTEDQLRAQVDAAVEAALSPANSRIKELEDQLGQSTTAAAIADAVTEAVSPLNEKIAELQASLDTELQARKAIEDEHKELVDLLEADAAERTARDRRDARIAAVKDTGVFPDEAFDEKVQINVDRMDKWATMDDSTFDALVEGWKAAEVSRKPAGDGPIPKDRSAMTDTVTGPAKGQKSSVRQLFESAAGLN